MKSMVVVTNSVTKSDYSSAQSFGELCVMSDKVYSFTPGSPANDILCSDIARVASRFDVNTDYVLPSGSSISTALFLIALFNQGVRVVKILMWNGNDQAYHAGLLDLSVATGEIL